jgi:DNA-directed RNA polymerase specialized sigma24 family protein
VLRLPKPEREALLAQYLYWEPVECRARRCHCSVPKFNRLLHQGRREVAAYLEGARDASERNL